MFKSPRSPQSSSPSASKNRHGVGTPLEWLTENLGLKGIAFVTAVFLWMAVLGSRSTEVVKDVMLDVVLAPDLAVSSDLPETVQFRLAGPRAFLRAIVSREEEPIRLELGAVKPGTVTYRLSPESMHVPIGVKVVSVMPTALTFQVEPVRSRDLPVRLDVRGKLSEGWQLKKMEIQPPQVTLRGPRSKIQGMTEILSAPIDLAEVEAAALRESGSAEYSTDRPLSLELPHPALKIDSKIPRVVLQLEPRWSVFSIKHLPVEVRGLHKRGALSLQTEVASVRPKTVTVRIRLPQMRTKEFELKQVKAFVTLPDRSASNAPNSAPHASPLSWSGELPVTVELGTERQGWVEILDVQPKRVKLTVGPDERS